MDVHSKKQMGFVRINKLQELGQVRGLQKSSWEMVLRDEFILVHNHFEIHA